MLFPSILEGVLIQIDRPHHFPDFASRGDFCIPLENKIFSRQVTKRQDSLPLLFNGLMQLMQFDEYSEDFY